MKKILITISIALFILLASFAVYFFHSIKTPLDKSADQNISFEITEGQSTSTISANLKDKEIISNAMSFQIYAYFKHKTFLPGIYYLRKNMTYDDIMGVISTGTVAENKITIPEGWRVTQIAKYLDENSLVKYDDFLAKAKDLEGYLFPDTYEIAIGATSADIISKMYANFNQRTGPLNLTKDQLILASIVEREANSSDDRAKIAGVYKNRLDGGMFLGADPTIQYALGSWDPITQADYQGVDSPYNTYTNLGLPPGPICNPGLASIKAAQNPESHDYYYFFHTSDGQTIYSSTLEEHESNLAQYQN